jgi:hypothetical protein
MFLSWSPRAYYDCRHVATNPLNPVKSLIRCGIQSTAKTPAETVDVIEFALLNKAVVDRIASRRSGTETDYFRSSFHSRKYNHITAVGSCAMIPRSTRLALQLNTRMRGQINLLAYHEIPLCTYPAVRVLVDARL